MQIIKMHFLLFTLVILGCSNAQDITNTKATADTTAVATPKTEPKPVGMVVTANPVATEVGLEILRAGGSAMGVVVLLRYPSWSDA